MLGRLETPAVEVSWQKISKEQVPHWRTFSCLLAFCECQVWLLKCDVTVIASVLQVKNTRRFYQSTLLMYESHHHCFCCWWWLFLAWLVWSDVRLMCLVPRTEFWVLKVPI
jgi:hypothetical protein